MVFIELEKVSLELCGDNMVGMKKFKNYQMYCCVSGHVWWRNN